MPTFRAYGLTQGVNKFAKGDQPRTWPVEDVVTSGDVADGKASFDSGEVLITKVVFYDDDEAVIGCVDVDAGGKISAECPPMPDASEVAEPVIAEATGTSFAKVR